MIARLASLIAMFSIVLVVLSGCTSSTRVTATSNEAWAACLSTAQDYGYPSRVFTQRMVSIDRLLGGRFEAGDWRDDLNRRVEFLLPQPLLEIKYAIVTVSDAQDGAVIEVEVRQASFLSTRWHRQPDDSNRILQEILARLAERASTRAAPPP